MRCMIILIPKFLIFNVFCDTNSILWWISVLFSQLHLHSWEILLKITVLHLQSDFSQRREHVFSSNLLWQTGLCIWSMDNKLGYYSDNSKCLESTFHFGPQRTFTCESMIIVTLTAGDPALSGFYNLQF